MTTTNKDNQPYVVVRSTTASPFAGYLKSEDGTEVVLVEARKIRRWYGAQELADLSERGTTKPAECWFSPPVPEVHIKSVNELYICTEKGAKSIQGVPEWTV